MAHHTRPGRLLILIPAYNEAACIGQVVQGARAILPQADVLVVDDGSDDDTAQVAGAAGAIVVRHPFNLGIGGTVQTGLKFARQEQYDVVIRIDGDGQHDPADMPMLLHALDEHDVDVVICSRFLADTVKMHIPFLRRLGILTFAAAVSLLTGRKATDTTSGFFALNRRAIEALANYMPQDYPEVEGRIILHKSGLTTLELPTQMRNRTHGMSSIDSWRSLYYALKVTVAVFTAALKEIPVLPRDTTSPEARPLTKKNL